jgi:hypothetical protein
LGAGHRRPGGELGIRDRLRRVTQKNKRRNPGKKKRNREPGKTNSGTRKSRKAEHGTRFQFSPFSFPRFLFPDSEFQVPGSAFLLFQFRRFCFSGFRVPLFILPGSAVFF